MNDDFSESIDGWVNELHHDDGVGLWQIFKYGREHYQLDEHQLMDFVRASLIALLDAGPIPMNSDGPGTPWRPENKYGFDKTEIVENIIREWFIERTDRPNFDAVWFCLPSVIKTN